MNEVIKCKRCNSNKIMKYGQFRGKQIYFCKDCRHKYMDNNALPKMKTSTTSIALAMSMYISGARVDSIQRYIEQQYNISLSKSAIYNWITRFSKEAVNRAMQFRPIVGDTWIADETVLRVGRKNTLFWDVIDLETNYILASRLINKRTIEDARCIMEIASQRAGKTPKRVITNSLRPYLDGIDFSFVDSVKHSKSELLLVEDSSDVMKKFHRALEGRVGVVTRLKNIEAAKAFSDVWLVNYNFFKKDSSLDYMPPARRMGIKCPFEDWMDVVKQATAMKPKLTVENSVHQLPLVLAKRQICENRPGNSRDDEDTTNSTSIDRDFELWVLLIRTRETIQKLRQKELYRYNIPYRQAAVLLSINAIGDKATPGRISKWLFREPHTISYLLSRMERQGLVRKVKDLNKKNLIRVILTEKGREYYYQASKRESIHKIMSCLSQEEREQLRMSLYTLRDTARRELGLERDKSFPFHMR